MRDKPLSEAKARYEARKVLKEYFVGASDEIDLETIANLNNLLIEYCEMDSCEGRLIANPPYGGIIRTKKGMHPFRERFTIAHELGHYKLHGDILLNQDSKEQLNSWHGNNIETEANIFAAELLMPQFLYQQEVKGKFPSLDLINKLSQKYRTSKLASLIQVIEYCNEPCAFVYSVNGKTKWTKPSNSFREMGYFISIKKQLHKHSVAADIFNGNNVLDRPEKVSAEIWIDKFRGNNFAQIWEDSSLYGEDVVSLIFVEDDI